MDIFPEIGPRKNCLVPPKFGARSPPMLLSFILRPISILSYMYIGGDLYNIIIGAEFGRERKKFPEPNFIINFFRKKFPFQRRKFLMTFFSHRPYFFPVFLPVFIVSNMI